MMERGLNPRPIPKARLLTDALTERTKVDLFWARPLQWRKQVLLACRHLNKTVLKLQVPLANYFWFP
jgi:hypothetical protein